MADFGKDGDQYVIIRADVVEGSDSYNLVVPVDAATGSFDAALEVLVAAVKREPTSVLRVIAYNPDPPHGASTFITPGELKANFMPEYCPPGRHPQSPGANPWG
jgi:hypothetical protein